MGWTTGAGLGKNLQGISEPISSRPHYGVGGIKHMTETYRKSSNAICYTEWVKAKNANITSTTCSKPLPEIVLYYANQRITALVDSGSEITCISEEIYEAFIKPNKPPMLPVKARVIKGAFGTKSKRITKQILLKVAIGNEEFDICFLIVQGLIRSCILGVDWLGKYQGTIDLQNNKLLIVNGGNTIDIPFNFNENSDTEGHEIEPEETEVFLLETQSETHSVAEVIDRKIAESNLSTENKLRLRHVMMTFKDLYSTKPGLTQLYQHEIQLSNHQPFARKSYPVPFALRPAVEEKLDEMINQGIIERTSSPYCSPMTVVKKKDGSVRICLDARGLNEKMISDLEGPPAIDELLQRFHGKIFLTSIDLVSSFWQIPLSEDSKKYTAFLYNGRSYCYKVLPFGLKTSVASFSRCMDVVLGQEVRDFTHNYIDDLLIASANFDEHLQHIQAVCEKLRKANMTINLEKTSFVKEVKFLGHILTPEGIQKDEEKVKAIMDFPKPTKLKQLRAFLGLCNYYRRYCKNYSEYSAQLNHLLKKGNPWRWGEKEEKGFLNIKQQFIKDVVLIHPDPKRSFILETDASNHGIGSVLYQTMEDGSIGVVAFYSRNLRGAELNYCTTEKELMAIVHSLQKFRLYLTGTEFLIRTDHQALTFLKTCKYLNERVTRWLLFLQQFNYRVEHIKGTENMVADTLSRYPSNTVTHGEQDPIVASFTVEGAGELLQEFKKLQNHQESDPLLGILIKHIKEKTEPSDKTIRRKLVQFSLENNILIYTEPVNKRKAIVVPVSLQEKLTWQYHQEMGHYGGQKVFTVMRHSFYWFNMKKKIKQFLRRCDICQKTKKSNSHLEGPLQPIIAREIGELVAVDFYGPLPKSRGGVTFILVAVDIFSKFIKLFPMKRATATTAANRIINEYYSIIKIKRILSDHGSQFTSKRWRNPLTENGIQITYATVRNPQSNPSERYMKEIGRLLRTYCSNKNTAWASYIKDIEDCLNCIPHSSTGRSAIEIITGKKPRYMLHDAIEKILPEQKETPAEIRDSVWQMLLTTSKKRKDNRKHKQDRLQVNDLVLLKMNPMSSASDGVTKKLQLIYDGPFKVTQVLQENVYEISYLYTDVKRGNYNIRNLKRYYSDS